MKIKVLQPFYDLKEEKERKVDEIFEATKKRFDEINKKLPGYLEEFKEVEEEPKDTKKDAKKDTKKDDK